MSIHTVISISRQFGSGGREIGRLVADSLEVPFYDNALIAMAAEKSGMSKQVLEHLDEKAASRFLYTVPSSIPSFGHVSTTVNTMPLSDSLFLTQYEIIKQLGEQGPCVIVGRCSDYILKDHPSHISIFIHAPEDMRAKRIAEYEQIEIKEALGRIAKYDKERRKYHDYYAAGSWGDATFYDLTLDSSVLGVQYSADFIVKFVQEMEKHKKGAS
ncbi:MAG: AAA family ATPase [Sphaerochaetaceae bacterium]|jgi:cytidylate kinase